MKTTGSGKQSLSLCQHLSIVAIIKMHITMMKWVFKSPSLKKQEDNFHGHLV